MKKILYTLVIAVLAFTSCEEWDPVFTGKYDKPEDSGIVEMEATHTIAQLVALYKTHGEPLEIDDDIIIQGVINTNDQQGNFYKSFYIQDETGGIEVKMGKNGLYNDYKPGQTIYVSCNGLTVGEYGYKSGNYGGNGMVQIGFSDPTGEYETSYLESSLLIDTHIFKGPYGDPVEPVVITESQLPSTGASLKTCPYLGKLVTLKGLKYGNETFTLLYLDSNQDKKAAKNRVFLSEATWGITTWAMSKQKMTEYLYSGIWDSAVIGSGNEKYEALAEHRIVNEATGAVTYPDVEKAAYSVSQYFKMGSKEIQIRTSGYSKFADVEIDPEVLAGNATLDVTGILTLYQGSIQFIIRDLDDVKVVK